MSRADRPRLALDRSVLEAGVDEAGRGPLAGPVVAAAVVLDPAKVPDGVDDSKKLTARRRQQLRAEIERHAIAWRVIMVAAADIDRLNILAATHVAMQRAVAGLGRRPARLLVDGNRAPAFDGFANADVVTVVGGDARHAAIAAASILAKTWRDDWMLELHTRWPQYGFAQHKGYPTPQHLAALQRHGPCDEHRRSFAPVQRALHRREAS